MSEELERKWREEFDEWRKGCSYSPMVRFAYLAARKKAQEEIERLHKKVTSLHGGYDEAVIIFNGECEKRDKLLEQAKPIMVLHHMDCVSGGDTEEQKEVEQWLKSYKEMKR